MKNIFLLLAIASTAFAAAQSNVVPLEKMSQKDLALRKVKDLDKILDLNEAQEKKLLELYSTKNVMAKRPKRGKQLASKRAQIDAKLKEILTPAQYSKLIEKEQPKETETKERY